MEIKDTDAAWAAGFIEGEGSLLIRKYQLKNHLKWTFRIVVVQKDPAALYELQKIFDCGVVKKRGNRNIYSWEVTSLNAANVLKYTSPYFRGKRGQVKICTEFIQTLRDYNNRVKGNPRALEDSVHTQ